MWRSRTFDIRVLRAMICALATSATLVSFDAAAQCGAKRSTCSGCHDGTRATSPSHDPWHDDHAFADLCPSCHGGRGDVDEAAAAHENLRGPLLDSSESCATCHGADTARFVDRYRNVRSTDAGVASIGAPSATPNASRVHGERGPNEAMTMLIVAVGALGTVIVGFRERDRNRSKKQGVS